MAKSESQIIEEIATRWGASVDVDLCKKIIHFIWNTSDEHLVRLTFLDFSRVTGLKPDDDRLTQVISLLSHQFSILSLHLVYFDDEGMSHDLNEEEIRYFFKTGQVADRAKGKFIDQASKSVFPYFSASKLDREFPSEL